MHKSELKRLVANQMFASSCPNAVVNLLSFLGISKFTQSIRLSCDRLIKEKIKSAWSPVGKEFDLHVICSDNMGMRSRMGYVQYTMLNHQFYPAEELIKAGIYPDPSDSDIRGANFTPPIDWDDIEES